MSLPKGERKGKGIVAKKSLESIQFSAHVGGRGISHQIHHVKMYQILKNQYLKSIKILSVGPLLSFIKFRLKEFLLGDLDESRHFFG